VPARGRTYQYAREDVSIVTGKRGLARRWRIPS